MQWTRAVFLTVFLLGGSPGSAVDPPSEPRPTDSPGPPHLSEIEEVHLVLLPAVVTDRKNRPVEGLEVADFTLAEDGIPQEIRVFATEENAPISLAFLLDVSASMGFHDQMGQAKRAIRAFVAALGDRDRFGLIGFADDQVTWITPFTSDRRNFLRRLEVQEPGGRTALWDALGRSPALVGDGGQGRRAIVLITDGFDNASDQPMLNAVWTARRTRLPIYTLSFVPMSPASWSERVRDSLALLGRFSEETGGRLFPIYRDPDLDRAVAEIQRELRFQYVLGYYPARREAESGRFRRIRLTTSRERHTVRARTGYYP